MFPADDPPVQLPWLDEPRFRCFGCSPRNPSGLALTMRRGPDSELTSDVVLAGRYASYPGVVHGGIVTTLVDELMGNLIALDHGTLAFSVTLRTRFLMPLRVSYPYRATARIVRYGGGLVHTQSDISDPSGETHVMADASYRPIRSTQARVLMGLRDGDLTRLDHWFDSEIGNP